MAWRIPITFSQRAADRANLTIKIHLDRLPSEYWDNNTSEEGADLRLFDSLGNELPLDPIRINPGAQTGVIASRLSLSGSNTTLVYLHFGDPGNTAPRDYDHAFGRFAVWQDYHRSATGGYDGNDRVASAVPTRPTFVRHLKEVGARTASLGVDQGCVYDRANDRWIAIGTNTLKLYDNVFTEPPILVNSDPCGDTGIALANHLSDGCIVGDEIIIPVQEHTTPTDFDNTHLCAFDTSTLQFVRKASIQAQNHNSSSVCYCPKDGLLYVPEYITGLGTLEKYNLADFSHAGSLAMTNASGIADPDQIQGIAWKMGAFWLSCQEDQQVNRCTYEGVNQGRYFDIVDTGIYQGLCDTPDGLALFNDVGDDSTGVVVFIEEELGMNFLSTSQGVKFSGVTISTTWTMGGFFTRSAGVNTTMALINYGGSSDLVRTVLGHRNTNVWGLWNTTDSWLNGAAVATGVEAYVAADSATTVARHTYSDSAVATDSTVTAKPGGAVQEWNIGSVVDDSQRFTGFGRDVWIRLDSLATGYVTDMGLADTDVTFYSVGSAEDLSTPEESTRRGMRNRRRHINRISSRM